MRYLGPVVLTLATLYVAWVNFTDPTRVMVFPLLDHLTADPHAQGHITLGLLALLALSAIIVAARPRPD